MTAQTQRQAVHAPGPATPETELVAAARAGEEHAVRELIRRLNPRLFRVARGIVGSDNEAEDVVQEAYVTAFTRLDTFRNEAKFSTWITRITINCALMRARRSRAHEEYDTVAEQSTARIVPFPGQHTEAPESALGRSQMRALLESAISTLQPDLRLPFLMREAEGMSVVAIARDLSLNPGTVKTRLFRARQQLRIALEQHVRGGFDSVFPFDGARCSQMADLTVARLRARGAL